MNRIKAVRTGLLISIAFLMMIEAFGATSPTIPRQGTGGNIGPCNWFVSLDGTTPVAEAMTQITLGGTTYNPGNNKVGTAGQDVNAFWQTLAAGTSPLNFCFASGTTFNVGSQVLFGMDLTVQMNGATFKYTGAQPGSNTAVWDNNASINLHWYGGTVDFNNLQDVFWGFGSSIGSNPSFALKSAGVRDLSVINCGQDCMLNNDLSNKNEYWTGFYSLKSATGTIADTNEMTGSGIWFEGVMDQNNVVASAWTSASLHNATIYVTTRRSVPGFGTPDVGLQPFTPPSGDQITNVDVYTNGLVAMVNGNLASGALAGSDIRVHGQWATGAEVGTNGGGAGGGGEVWKHVSLDGSWLLQKDISLYDYDGLALQNMDIVATSALSGLNGIVYSTSTSASDRLCCTNLVVSNVRWYNVTAAEAGNYLWSQNSGNNKVGNAEIIGGSIASATNTLAASSFISSGIGTTTLTVAGVQGYSSTVSGIVTASASIWTYTNNDGWGESMTLSLVGGISGWTCNGITSYPMTVGTVCVLPPKNQMSVTWATTAPQFTKAYMG